MKHALSALLAASTLASIVAAGAAVSGCVVVKPYQREHLSERVMTPGAEGAEDEFRQHWQSTREGSVGGFGAAGGGCGCN